MTRAFVLLPALLLADCGTAGKLTGLITGGAVGAATANPAVGYVVGLGTAAGATYALNYAARVRQNAEQDAIATAAGSLKEGATAPWRIGHTIPIGNEHGTVRVTRLIETPLATCREIVFSVEDEPATPPLWYATSICRRDNAWKWAESEPSVTRWGYLQSGN